MKTREHPLFATLTAKEMEGFISACNETTVSAGTTIIEGGTHGNFLYFVLEGSLTVFTVNDSNKEHELAVIEAPAVVGEMEAFSGDVSSASVRARTEIAVLTLGFDRIHRLIETGDAAAAKVMLQTGRILARRLSAMNQKLSSIKTPEAPIGELRSFYSKLLEDWSA